MYNLTPTIPGALPRDYYLKNFRYLLDFVAQRYQPLLTQAEQDFARRFGSLSVDGQRLYVRLCSRQGPIFRSDGLQYSEVANIGNALRELIICGFAEEAGEADFEDCLKKLRKHELAALLPGPVTHLTRTALLELVAVSIDDGAHSDRLPCIMFFLCGLDLLRVYRLLFFGNVQQDMSEFVLNEIGVNAYEDYEIEAGARSLVDRQVVDELLAIEDLWAETGEAMAAADIVSLCEIGALLGVARCAADRPRRRLDRLLNRVARQLEREGRTAEALWLYDRACSPPARERQARILASMGEPRQAIRHCEQIISAPRNDDEYEFAVRFLQRLAGPDNKLLHELPDLRYRTEQVRLRLLPVEGVSVESLVCLWAESRGFDSYYLENALFPGLLGLAFWDIIFAPVPEVFFNPFQRGPADQFGEGFTRRRQVLIDNRFAELVQNEHRLGQIIRQQYQKKLGVANHLVRWQRLSPGIIDRALEAIPNRHLIAIFRQLLPDLRGRTSGFPDLILFRDGRYELVEVKAPGDRLQVNQQRWFRFFEREHIPARVVNVEYPGPGDHGVAG